MNRNFVSSGELYYLQRKNNRELVSVVVGARGGAVGARGMGGLRLGSSLLPRTSSCVMEREVLTFSV